MLTSNVSGSHINIISARLPGSSVQCVEYLSPPPYSNFTHSAVKSKEGETYTVKPVLSRSSKIDKTKGLKTPRNNKAIPIHCSIEPGLAAFLGYSLTEK